MAEVLPVGEPVNDAERRAIAWLRDRLPDSYKLLHNFEIIRGGEHFEVDLAVVTPHAVYLVDVKGTRGRIDVYGPKWYPEGRQPFTSPLLKLRSHARALKGLITESQPGRRELEKVYVDAVVLLPATDAQLVDPDGRDSASVTTLRDSVQFFQNTARIPGWADRNISRLYKMVLGAITGIAQPQSGLRVLGSWEITERLGGTDSFIEYRAMNAFAGQRGGTVLLRAYRADPYLPDLEREAQRARISNAYTALSQLPSHPGVAGARDFFPTENEDLWVLVTEDTPGQALRLHIDKPALALTLDQKLRVARELMEALDHCHTHGVVHRNLTPGTILLGTDGHVRLTSFDFARAGTDRSRTIAGDIVEEVDPRYSAPEAYRDPAAASPASDVFSAGLVLYELLTGEHPFSSPTALFDQGAVFPLRPSAQRSEVPPALDGWLQTLCTFDPDRRPAAADALSYLEKVLGDAEDHEPERVTRPPSETKRKVGDTDYRNLPAGALLLNKLEVQRRLGIGSFGVVYRVVDTLGDVTRALKVILRDRHSPLDRLKKEYRTLLRTPEHPHVVRVVDAGFLPDGPPYLLFEYVEGEDVGALVEGRRFAPEDGLELMRQVAAGLAHLHRYGVFHCDIKPRNLVWTSHGAKIIDFNVSVRAEDKGHGGGSRRYLPPDLDLSAVPTESELTDRDLYALGLTTYEAITGRYPWEATTPLPGEAAPDPRTLPGYADLAPELVAVLLRSIAPKRAERYASAVELLKALESVHRARRATTETSDTSAWLVSTVPGDTVPPNTNPFVSYLLTLYSQSPRTNAGTRGLDALGRKLYVPTLLDEELLPAVLRGEFRLVIITGNAGDGKTAFLQQLEAAARGQKATFEPPLPNGQRFNLGGRTFLTNYDGSQDEEERANDDVLRAFFAPFAGADPDTWPGSETRLVAINEGRLVDFLSSEEARFPALRALVERGLLTGADEQGVAVVNLNLRSVVAEMPDGKGSLVKRLVERMTDEKYWAACQTCELRDRCYAYHNARTFQDDTAGPQVTERLETLYTLTHLRGRLHITLRDLRSAVAFMLVGTRDCAGIHELYQTGRRDEIAESFYFNSWMGGDSPTSDRLLSLLKDVDVGQTPGPRLDRSLDFISPHRDRSLFTFAQRGEYDRNVLRALFENLPRDFSGQPNQHRTTAHQRYVAMTRRRAFFERRDEGWRAMLPYRSADRMLALIRGEEDLDREMPRVLRAINRGEGLSDPGRLGGSLAIRVRDVERGTIRSYRLFPGERFSLAILDAAARARFVEHMPEALALRYSVAAGNDAELVVDLDVYEMLDRLNRGYRPSLEEEQGYYLSLAVFKNVLGSAPYQEVLLTTTGHDFYRIEREADGRLTMDVVSAEVA